MSALPAMYEDLANHFARQGESRQRDQCLLLAADAALSAGLPQEAERLRKRLLLTNPHHMLRPYPSLADALKSNDVRDYVADLRKQWPPATVEKLLKQPQAKSEPPAAPAVKATKAPPKPAEPTDEPATFVTYTMTLVVLGAGLLLALTLLVTTIVLPLME